MAVVTDGIYPYFKGGKEVRYHELLPRVARPGVRIDVYTMRWWGRAPRPRGTNVTYQGLCRAWPMYSGGRRSVLQAVVFAVGCTRLLFKRYDVIDADHMPYVHMLPLRAIAWFRRVPLVVTWHEWWGRDYWRTYLGRFGRAAALLERTVARTADHVVVTTESTAESLRTQGVAPGRISVLPLGVDLSAVERAPAARRGYDVLYIGRLLSHKRVDVLISAIAQLRDEGMRLSCGIFGAGPEADRLRALVVENELEDQVDLGPAIGSQTEVFSLMKAARVFAYPSVREGFGLAVVEALACGAPVVTTDHPDNHARHLVDDEARGALCAPNPASLAASLRQVLSSPGGPPRPRVDGAAWDWQRRADQLLDVYRSQLGPASISAPI